MIRSRSNEADKPDWLGEFKPPHASSHRKGTRSEIESLGIETLAGEHRQLAFWLLQETRKNLAAIIKRLLVMLVAASLMLSGLALIIVILLSGSMFANQVLRFLYILGEMAAALLLTVSMGFALYGAAFTSSSGATISIPGEPLPRQHVLNLALADLSRLRQTERRAGFTLRWSALFFLASLLPYLFVMLLLVL